MRLAVYSHLAVLAACGHAPPRQAAAAQRPVGSAGDLAGTYTASDDLDFTYRLVIAPDGSLDLVSERNRLGRCEQKGALAPAADHRFTLTFRVDECQRAAVGTAADVVVYSFTGDTLDLGIGPDRRTYRRATQ